MTTTEESGRFITPERIRRGVVCYEDLLGTYLRSTNDTDDLEDRALIESGLLEHLCAQIVPGQEPTANWREVLKAL